MTVSETPDRMEYTSVRHFGPGRSEIVVEPGSPIQPNDLELFLTARFRLYTKLAGRLAFAQVEHPPWPLQAANQLRVQQNLIECSGVPRASGAPLAHFSPGVDTRIGAPHLVP
jgi:uncharacterized protein YqjF (DUF2071 family)